MGTLDGKVALVTGGSRGIGRAVARRLAADGAAVAVGYRTRAEEAEAVVAACREDGGVDAWAVAADLASVEGVRTLFGGVAERFGRLDVLVNNAGRTERSPIADTTEEAYDETFATNAKATFFALQEAARRMADGGCIVNLSSVRTLTGTPGTAAYAAAKAAVEVFTRVAAKELGTRGITVNAVAPGATDTDMIRSVNSPEALAQMAAASPFGRLGAPEDVADVVAWLASDAARWVTGQTIHANGGLV